MFENGRHRRDAGTARRYYRPISSCTRRTAPGLPCQFAASHDGVYATEISYAIEYDDEAWVEAPDRVAGRLWITTARPGEEPTRIEVVLIAAYRDGLIHRIWETTWPSLALTGCVRELLSHLPAASAGRSVVVADRPEGEGGLPQSEMSVC